jgi:hypothetical protein
MSFADRDAGRMGRAYEPGMDYGDWLAGQTETRPPIGLAAIPLLLLAPIFYPAAGLIVLAVMSVVDLILRSMVGEGMRLLLGLAAAIAVFVASIRLERLLSRFFLYRMVRSFIRVGFLTAFSAMLLSGQLTNRYAAREPAAGEIAGGLVIGLLGLWISLRADRSFGVGRPPKASDFLSRNAPTG